MPYKYADVISRYRTSPKGKDTARKYANDYYHKVLKHKPEVMEYKRKANRYNHYFRKYGITPAQADEMKLRGCDICGDKEGKMNIDHCHKSGKVRGVLCNPCNLTIGWLERADENIDKIRKYLERG